MYSAIMNELVNKVIDEVVAANKEGRVGAPPGVAYSCDTAAQHADCAAYPGDCSVDPELL